MRRRDTHTLQVWPSGHGYEYTGEPYGWSPPDPARRLRVHSYNGGPLKKRWRKGKADEWAAIAAEVRAERYVDQEILKCDSMLVGALLEAVGTGEIDHGHDLADEWTFENITNQYPDPSEWTFEQCREWLDDHGVSCPDDEADVADWAEAIRDHAEPQEIYEWWAISSWLATELTAIGEPVLDNAYGYWWGRTCTGQGMIMDGTLQRVARRHEQR